MCFYLMGVYGTGDLCMTFLCVLLQAVTLYLSTMILRYIMMMKARSRCNPMIKARGDEHLYDN